MKMRMLKLSRILQSALVVVSLAGAAVQAQAPAQAPASAAVPAKGGQMAFWCKSPNGVAALQLESCEPGTEVRSEPVGPHGRVASPPPGRTGVPPVSPAAMSAVARSAPAAVEAAPAIAPRSNVLRVVVVSVLMLLGVGLVLGLMRKFRARSF